MRFERLFDVGWRVGLAAKRASQLDANLVRILAVD